MPTPKPGEKKDDFISRCIPMIIKEKQDKKEKISEGQPFAICQSIWTESKKKKNKEDKLK